VDLTDFAYQLGTREDIISVLVECGGTLAAGLLGAGLIDRWISYIAPKVVGGQEAPGPLGSLGITSMKQARPVTFQKVRRCGLDIVIDARFG
jgi:diaminohydroxyphosphoribosylaminopyrimidine deaminase/5-amino-6-(5-phosphoribosylamino)uracil reductase